MEADLKGEYKGVKGLNALYRRLIAKQFTAIADLHSVLRSSYLRMRFNLATHIFMWKTIKLSHWISPGR
jgi:ADP-heptose:LPS heptosyltransferase